MPAIFTPAFLRECMKNIYTLVKELPEADLPVKHTFAPGVYIRELFIPKGTLVVGKTHRHETANIISKGDISILTVKGMVRFRAPYTVVSAPGIQKIGYAHEDTIWINIHGTHETDLERIEELFIIPEKELECLGQ